jgi:DNA-binding NtrC family response regulator
MTATIRVLVADDEKNLRELLVRELTRKGHTATGVPDGQAALDALKDDLPDVLLLDMKMPRMEGIEVLRALQELAESPQVIVMTGFQEVSNAVEAMKLGAYDYLTKPARIEELGRNGAAVHGDERPVGALRVRMDRARDELLARAALAHDQDRRIGGSHLADQLADLLDQRVLTDQEGRDRIICLIRHYGTSPTTRVT